MNLFDNLSFMDIKITSAYFSLFFPLFHKKKSERTQNIHSFKMVIQPLSTKIEKSQYNIVCQLYSIKNKAKRPYRQHDDRRGVAKLCKISLNISKYPFSTRRLILN